MHVLYTIGIIGFVFVVIFNGIASVVFVQVLLKTLLQKMEVSNYSFDYYGMITQVSICSCFSVRYELVFEKVHFHLGALVTW